MAVLPYCQALKKFIPHIQQARVDSIVSMESNGKGVSFDGVPLPFEAGEIDFGEPDTNGQYSFYQLIHQGCVIPCDFIGVVKSQQPMYLKVVGYVQQMSWMDEITGTLRMVAQNAQSYTVYLTMSGELVVLTRSEPGF
ncbi:hypothetical protein C5167_037310 [Papaver somniferum]|uniref:Uncharacterized protein n=1 Tax=Papaver somniferum TaxID=3469 RepID=A0A4Y7I9I1_PAPSO|nr:hypothetical protein C5167_037310 [Papaver somniferum]